MRNQHKHVSIDYYSYVSGMREWSAGFKVLFAAVVIFVTLLSDSVFVSCISFVYMSFMILKIGRIHLDDYFHLLKVPAAFIILGAITILVQFGQGDNLCLIRLPVFSKYIYITKDTLEQAVGLTCKAFAAVSGLYMMTLSTPMGEIIAVCRKVHVPGLIVELMYLIYRYIFILSETNRQQMDAAKSRLGYIDFKTSLKTFSGAAANLLIIAVKKSSEFYDSMEARGYDGRICFLEQNKSVTKKQVIYMAVYIVIVLLLFLFKQNFIV